MYTTQRTPSARVNPEFVAGIGLARSMLFGTLTTDKLCKRLAADSLRGPKLPARAH